MIEIPNSRRLRWENLESAAGVGSGGIVDHLEDEGAAGAHLDLPDVESEAEEGFKEGALAIGLAADGDDFWNGELLSEGDGGGLEAIVGLEAGFEIGVVGGRICGVGLVGFSGRHGGRKGFRVWGFDWCGVKGVGSHESDEMKQREREREMEIQREMAFKFQTVERSIKI